MIARKRKQSSFQNIDWKLPIEKIRVNTHHNALREPSANRFENRPDQFSLLLFSPVISIYISFFLSKFPYCSWEASWVQDNITTSWFISSFPCLSSAGATTSIQVLPKRYQTKISFFLSLWYEERTKKSFEDEKEEKLQDGYIVLFPSAENLRRSLPGRPSIRWTSPGYMAVRWNWK